MSSWPIGGAQRFASIGEDAAASRGTTITAAGTANTKGSYTQLVASTPFDIDELQVAVAPGTSFTGYLVDIALGGAGSEVVLIPDLSVASRTGGVVTYPFPISIPAGTRISARCQSATISATCFVKINAWASKWGLHVPHSRVIAVGTSTTNSRCTEIDPGGTANTKGAYVQLTSSLPSAIQGLVICTDSANGAKTTADWLVDVAIGGAGSETVLIPDIWTATDVATDSIMPGSQPFIPAAIPAGTRIAVRAACSIIDASDRLLDVAFYGVV